MPHPLIDNQSGETRLLLGNEAIVRGALEAGVDCVTCYPGTPSSEVPDTFYRIKHAAPESAVYHFEYSPNEKVALEVGGGASLAGAMTLVTMKHVGVNVAADPLCTIAYVGSPGGLVLLSADDPGCHSSQNEQDNRIFARLAGLPVFEPATAQECKDMTREALLFSRRTGRPVLLRTTTRVNHIRGPVRFGERHAPARSTDEKPFVKNPSKYVPIPAFARRMRLELLDHLAAMAEESEQSPWLVERGSGKVAVIATGISRAYLSDALELTGLGDQVRVLELGLTYPLPEKKIAALMGEVQRLLVLEEGEPVLERELRELARRAGVETEVVGKMGGVGEDFTHVGGVGLPRFGEYETSIAANALRKLVDPSFEPSAPVSAGKAEGELPMRPPNLCAGCSHRSLYYAVRQQFGDDAVYSSDIGCYTLGILPPLSAADFLFCMGSSISGGSGMARFDKRPVIAFIGDSTFFHSGVTGLINAVFNKHELLVVVLDNRTTAMTGHQPHPGVDATLAGVNEAMVDIEAVCRAVGVEHVRKVNPNKLNTSIAALKELSELPGVKVLIAEEPCVLFARRALKKKTGVAAEVSEQGPAVEFCLETLACPAFFREDGGVDVDPVQCSGCMVCAQITKEREDTGAIKARKKG
ncbi:MAG: indolepyruvate ferredoxin oxidoreductase subunit alpha [Oceanidesulfovibrio sp.]